MARQVLSSESGIAVVLRDARAARLDTVARSLGEGARIDPGGYTDPLDVDVAVLAGPPGTHLEPARRFVAAGVTVVSVADEITEVVGPCSTSSTPRRRERQGVTVAVGTGVSPLGCRACSRPAHASAGFDSVDEIHVAKVGTGGSSACARQHCTGPTGGRWPSTGVRPGGWAQRPGGQRSGSCAGSPTRWEPRTATAPRWPMRSCWCRPSRGSGG